MSKSASDAALHNFLRDALKLGCVKGFKWFSLYLRGREELVVTIKNGSIEGETDARRIVSSLVDDESHPPASPFTAEMPELMTKDESTVYLIGGYARYKCPFVWLRSKNHRLRGVVDKETPLRLETTENWKAGGVKVWDIIAELVSITTRPVPPNPFEVDFAAFDGMAPFDLCMASAAAVNFLRKLYITDNECSPAIYEDLQRLLALHFTVVGTLMPPKDIERRGTEEEDNEY